MTGATAVRTAPPAPGAAEDVVLRIRGLAKSYGRVRALDGVDLDLHAGEVLGYLGPNGAGKTTTLRIVLGLLRPSAGSVTVFGQDAWREAHLVHRDVGYVPGEPALAERLTGRQQVRATARLRGLTDDGRAVEVADRLGLDLEKPARALSRGNRQKLAVVLALLGRPRLLVLDEPTTGFDPLVQREFHALVREHTAAGGSVLLSSHVLGEVEEIADRVAVLRAGRLVAEESMAALRERSLHQLRVRFAQAVDASELAGVPGVLNVTATGAELRCSAPSSSLDELLRSVCRHRVLDLECTDSGLEATFLAYYGEGAR